MFRREREGETSKFDPLTRQAQGGGLDSHWLGAIYIRKNTRGTQSTVFVSEDPRVKKSKVTYNTHGHTRWLTANVDSSIEHCYCVFLPEYKHPPGNFPRRGPCQFHPGSLDAIGQSARCFFFTQTQTQTNTQCLRDVACCMFCVTQTVLHVLRLVSSSERHCE